MFLTATIGEIVATAFLSFGDLSHVKTEPIADMGISLICQYAVAFVLVKCGKDKYSSLIIGDIASNILLAVLIRF
ncbi:hypothetical protein FD723_39660 (plasmid) [Nostoc sp. C052]|uniref:hypothetical protein n=1 Tax=Nostoc sp. C052 TaxID=2576902 RepID=UPI0015C377D6|nr:hypothetical protein [Nostoc sp. C052]QLE46329.1 hypothetical protein FD723_39660 [Nostoc sp. C052]